MSELNSGYVSFGLPPTIHSVKHSMLEEEGNMGYAREGLCQGRPEDRIERQREDQSIGMLGECILRPKGRPWETKDDIHKKDRMVKGLTTNLSPGGERPLIIQSDRGG